MRRRPEGSATTLCPARILRASPPEAGIDQITPRAAKYRCRTVRRTGNRVNRTFAWRDPAYHTSRGGFGERDGFKRRGSDHERHFARSAGGKRRHGLLVRVNQSRRIFSFLNHHQPILARRADRDDKAAVGKNGHNIGIFRDQRKTCECLIIGCRRSRTGQGPRGGPTCWRRCFRRDRRPRCQTVLVTVNRGRSVIAPLAGKEMILVSVPELTATITDFLSAAAANAVTSAPLSPGGLSRFIDPEDEIECIQGQRRGLPAPFGWPHTKAVFPSG